MKNETITRKMEKNQDAQQIPPTHPQKYYMYHAVMHMCISI